MNNRRYWLICAVAVAAFYGSYVLADVPSFPQETELGLIGRANPALKGINTVVFVFRPVGDEPNNTAVWKVISRKVTKQLGSAGIRCLISRPGAAMPVDASVFTLDVDMLKPADSKQYVFRVQTSLATDVCLKDNSSVCLKAELWKTASAMKAVARKNIYAAIAEEVFKQAEAFTLAHSAANQAKGPADKTTVPQAVGKQTRRETKQIPAEYLYVASKKSKVFHRPDCISVKRISTENLVGFATREEAVKTGRRPCKRCNP